MTVFPLLLYTVCHHCLQCIDFPSNRDSFYAFWWQSDNLLQMLHAPPEAYLISWILLYHPGPLASLFDCLLLWPGLGGIAVWACRGLQSPGTSITKTPPFGLRGGWAGPSFVRVGLFRPIPCPASSSNLLLTAPICLPDFTESKSMQGTHTFSPCASAPHPPSLSLSGFLLPSLQHVRCVAINKMAALSAMWQAI